MGREAVGATYSICREGAIAITGQVYGLDSPEVRGTLGTYIVGTLFGAVYMGHFVGLIASLRWLHPWAIGMGITKAPIRNPMNYLEDNAVIKQG